MKKQSHSKDVSEFLAGKSQLTVDLFSHFIHEFNRIGPVELHAAATMIGIATPQRKIAYITQLGKNFIHVVFPLSKAYDDNLCFQKIAHVPGQQQFNHHFRMLAKEDVNNEMRRFMKLAYRAEQA